MNIEYLKKFVTEKCDEHPFLARQIRDLYWLCVDEIEEGGSESNEVQLCISDIDALIGSK